MYGGRIFKKYRANATLRFGEDFFTASNRFGSPLPLKDPRKRNARSPIFWEFVQFVIHDQRWERRMNIA